MKKVIITILDGIKETSMPFNEFVLWRANHFKDELQHLIICNNEEPLPKVKIPDNLRIEYIGRNVLSWRHSITKILKKYDEENIRYAIHLHQAGPSMKILLLMMGTGFNNKVVFTVHNSFTGYPFHNKIRSYIDGCMANYVVCCGKTAYAAYPQSIKRIKGDNVSFIQNGVDTERIDSILNSVEKKSNERLSFAYVARMVPVKNHNFLIDVVKRISLQAEFLLIGKSDSEIVNRIKNEGLSEKLDVVGLIPRNEVFERLANSDVYISTSTLEGLPVSVLEGMYVGMPAILSDIPQHREVADNEEFVSIVPLDEDLWIKEINKYSKMSKEQLKELGAKSRAYVKERFSLVAMHKKYDDIYKKLI